MKGDPASDAAGQAAGLAWLDFAVRAGRTRLVRAQIRPPLGIMRTLYLDEALPDMAFAFLTNPTAGILQGDVQQIEVNVGEGARAHVTTQSATKVFTMPAGAARQCVRLNVQAAATLEYLPDGTVPFRGARLEASTDVVVHPGGTAIVGEVLSSGRAAMGESFAYSKLGYRLTVRTPDGMPVYHEAFDLEPGRRSPAQLGVLAGHTALGTLLLIGEKAGADPVVESVRAALGAASARSGVSRLPLGAGIAIKLLGNDAAEVRTALTAAWAAARPQLLGTVAPPLRKY